MKLYEVGSIIVIIVSLATAIGILSSLLLFDDNSVEEACEQVIEIVTGNKIDLTEQSSEDKENELKKQNKEEVRV